jgi:hypothetical protein
MRATVSPEAEDAITDIAQRHGLSREAVLAMLFAVHTGGGTMAQFAIPELGGSGQWMRGGMTMVGNMFDNALKARVDALCGELSQLLATTKVFPASASASGFTSGNWWPAELGVPSSSGGQNDARYAVFPGTRRLAIQVNGNTRVFDTGEHRIGGVQQHQGGTYGSVTFTSQLGTFDVSSLPELGSQRVVETPSAAPTPEHPVEPAPHVAPQSQAPAPASAGASGDPVSIVAAIESLAGLHERGILTDEEFAAKKTELLGRL